MAENTTNITDLDDVPSSKTWTNVTISCEIINVLFMATTFWILACLILYGTKTGRWKKKPGASSLNSGLIYTTCVGTVGLICVRLIMMEVLYQAPRLDRSAEWCNRMSHAITISYGICTYFAYFFVYIRQRLIYTNPFVKGKLGPYAVWISRFALVFLTAGFVGLGFLYVLPVSYQTAPYGCILAPPESDGFIYKNTSDVLLGVTFVLIQLMIVCLSAYPAVRVKFEASTELKHSSRENLNAEPEHSPPFCIRCGELFSSGQHVSSSPIKMAVRRTLICSLVLVVTAVILVGVDILAVSRDFPISVAQTIYDIGSIVNIFAMLSTFGFAGEILTLLCPKIDMNRRRSQQSYARGDSKPIPVNDV